MKLSTLIDELLKIHTSEKNYDPIVSILTDIESKPIDLPLMYEIISAEHEVTRIFKGESGQLLIVGREINGN